MTTIHHGARKVAREAIGSPCHAEIADLLFFRVTGSKYSDEMGKFFLLPKVDHIAEQTGYSNKLCLAALRQLDDHGWIIRVRKRCFDGAVRTKIYISDKFSQLMEDIFEQFKNANPPLVKHDYDDHDNNGIAELDEKVSSIIKDQTKKDHNNRYNKPSIAVKESLQSVNFHFSFDLDESTEAFQFVNRVAMKHHLDFTSLLMTLIDLQETQLYRSTKGIVNDAINILKRIEAKENTLPQNYHALLPKKAIFHAEDERSQSLTPRQQVAISQTLNDLINRSQTAVTCIKEVFSWIEYQMINPASHFIGKGFKHALNIVKKMLSHQGSRQYSKPFGFA